VADTVYAPLLREGNCAWSVWGLVCYIVCDVKLYFILADKIARGSTRNVDHNKYPDMAHDNPDKMGNITNSVQFAFSNLTSDGPDK
jgi:hypothetical protein